MVRSRVLVLNFLWQTNRCSRTGHDHYALTTPSFLSRGTPERKVSILSEMWPTRPMPTVPVIWPEPVFVPL